MAKIKALIASIMCGLSTLTIVPSTNYAQHIPASADVITKTAWRMTGESLRKSTNKVGKRLGTPKTIEAR